MVEVGKVGGHDLDSTLDVIASVFAELGIVTIKHLPTQLCPSVDEHTIDVFCCAGVFPVGPVK